MSKLLNKSLSIDKSNWTKVKLGDVIAEPRNTVKDFVSEQIEHVVGLEHIDSEDIHLRRSANMDSSTTFTKKFSVRDVLFGRRRAYLKKAAQAKFSGICSGDITVLRAKEVLLPELLPFVINNDKFFDYAVMHSAGGLSPRVKFKDLAHYEFLLPPEDQQSKLAELLWSMDEMVEKELDILERLRNYRTILHKYHFYDYKNSQKKVGDYTSKVGSGVTPKGGSKVYQANGIRFIRSQNVHSGILNLDDLAFISDEVDKKMSSSRVLKNDVLLNITGASIGRCAVYSDDIKANVNQHVCIIRLKEGEFDPILLCEFMNSEYGQNQVQLLQAGGNREGLNFTNIRIMQVPDYSYEEQVKLRAQYQLIERNRINILSKINDSKILQKSLINQIF